MAGNMMGNRPESRLSLLSQQIMRSHSHTGSDISVPKLAYEMKLKDPKTLSSIVTETASNTNGLSSIEINPNTPTVSSTPASVRRPRATWGQGMTSCEQRSYVRC
jgi:hypothetical protein